MKVTEVPIDQIEVDHETQSRASTSAETVAEYQAAWAVGVDFPPVELFSDGETYRIGDGVHRVLSAAKAGLFSVPAHVHKGDQHAAAIFACGANKSHGLKRSNADKRKCVERMLTLEPEWADRRIAEHVGVGVDLVGDTRRQLSESDSCEVDVTPPTRVGSDGKRRKSPAPKPVPKRPESQQAETAAEPNDPQPAAEPQPAVAESPVADLLADTFFRDSAKQINAIRKGLKARLNDPRHHQQLKSFGGRLDSSLGSCRDTLSMAQADATCTKCAGKGCPKCFGTGYLTRLQTAGKDAKR